MPRRVDARLRVKHLTSGEVARRYLLSGLTTGGHRGGHDHRAVGRSPMTCRFADEGLRAGGASPVRPGRPFVGTGSVGILPPAARQPNGYREYAEEDLERLRLVVAACVASDSGPKTPVAWRGWAWSTGEVDRDLVPLLAEQRAQTRSSARRPGPSRRRTDRPRGDATAPPLGGPASAEREDRCLTLHPRPLRVHGNSARSQIAEAVLGRLGGPDFEVHSAGTEPKGVNPYTGPGPR